MSPLSRNSERSAAAVQEESQIVCLCGSTKFKEVFEQENRRLTLDGYIVLSAGVFPNAPENASGGIDDEQKRALDELHLEKIRLSDEVRVLNVGGYVGDSTAAEIAYAQRLGTPVSYYELPGTSTQGSSA